MVASSFWLSRSENVLWVQTSVFKVLLRRKFSGLVLTEIVVPLSVCLFHRTALGRRLWRDAEFVE
jgi:hypothetical protein